MMHTCGAYAKESQGAPFLQGRGVFLSLLQAQGWIDSSLTIARIWVGRFPGTLTSSLPLQSTHISGITPTRLCAWDVFFMHIPCNMHLIIFYGNTWCSPQCKLQHRFYFSTKDLKSASWGEKKSNLALVFCMKMCQYVRKPGCIFLLNGANPCLKTWQNW